MVDQLAFVPLSPPTSPRMSAYLDTVDPDWQHQLKSFENTGGRPENNMALVDSSMPTLALDMQRHPLLRSHKSFPNTLRTSGVPIRKPDTPEHSSGPSPDAQTEYNEVSNSESSQANVQALPTISIGGSAPVSPVSNLTPTSDKQEHPQDSQDLNGLDIDAESADDEEIEDCGRPLTAAELRAQKRKMKRFR